MENSRQFKKPDFSTTSPEITGTRPAAPRATTRQAAFENTAGYRVTDRTLERAKPIEIELQGKTPRKVAPLETSGHTHLARGLLIGAVIGLLILIVYLCLVSYQTYNDLPIFPIASMVLGLGLLGFFTFKHVPQDCDCHVQRLMVVSGEPVIGQITEKRETKTPDGKTKYHIDYVFQTKNQQDSHWGSMHVTEPEYKTVFEGDDITVLYTKAGSEVTSRLYRFCAFQAIAGKEQFISSQ